ncbi:hypothetical protein [Gramella sp. KN1008]|uniref:hypothetical protein n=1 Tax=Gramella sp. KN1008 TaxID=2529298 RepID=UPI00103A849C|nr:hypothetical protein [Gramella sp. KN1008]TBW28263.1 hypothetical protein EZJ28_05820 [Gramella sp. KN1008]
MEINFHIKSYNIKEGFWKTNSGDNLFKDWKILNIVPGKGYLISQDKELNFVNFDGRSNWRSSVFCTGKPDLAAISYDRLILTTTTEDYHSWDFLGPAILIDLETGNIIKELKGERVEGLFNGEFILGLEGYDYFHTWLYNRDGNLLQEWKSYGEYLPVNNEIIVIEENRQNPHSSYLNKLNRDGSISKGMKLKSSRSSNPLLVGEDTFLFENAGYLIIADSKLKEISTQKLINYDPSESSCFSSRIQRYEDVIEIEILERTPIPQENYRTHIFKIQI